MPLLPANPRSKKRAKQAHNISANTTALLVNLESTVPVPASDEEADSAVNDTEASNLLNDILQQMASGSNAEGASSRIDDQPDYNPISFDSLITKMNCLEGQKDATKELSPIVENEIIRKAKELLLFYCNLAEEHNVKPSAIRRELVELHSFTRVKHMFNRFLQWVAEKERHEEWSWGLMTPEEIMQARAIEYNHMRHNDWDGSERRRLLLSEFKAWDQAAPDGHMLQAARNEKVRPNGPSRNAIFRQVQTLVSLSKLCSDSF